MENPIIVDLSTTYGGVLVGISLSSMIYGISCLQTYAHCLSDVIVTDFEEDLFIPCSAHSSQLSGYPEFISLTLSVATPIQNI